MVDRAQLSVTWVSSRRDDGLRLPNIRVLANTGRAGSGSSASGRSWVLVAGWQTCQIVSSPSQLRGGLTGLSVYQSTWRVKGCRMRDNVSGSMWQCVYRSRLLGQFRWMVLDERDVWME